ncbi:MAG: RNA pseudouridine synthase [Chitinophagaceae bacterium]
MNIPILFENENYVFANKPSGLLSIADRHNEEIPSLHRELMNKYNIDLFIIHRLDKETSGCICLAKNKEAHRHASLQFEHREVTKIYHCIVHGKLPKEEGTIQEAIMEHPTIKGKMVVNHKQGKESITAYKVLETYGLYSHVACTLLTGRTHQIRVHMANAGCPILCDSLYGKSEEIYISNIKKRYKLSKNDEEEKPILNHLALHAHTLSLKDINNTPIHTEAPLPKELKALLNQCKKWLI